MGLPPLSVEEPFGIFDRGLLESILLRPAHGAVYEEADEYTQAATLLWGLVRSHAFVQGNKRTATAIAFFFLERAGYAIMATDDGILDLVYAVETGRMPIEEVAGWLRTHSQAPR